MKRFMTRHECLGMRDGVAETFYEHSWFLARDEREAQQIAARIPLDARCRRLVMLQELPSLPLS